MLVQLRAHRYTLKQAEKGSITLQGSGTQRLPDAFAQTLLVSRSLLRPPHPGGRGEVECNAFDEEDDGLKGFAHLFEDLIVGGDLPAFLLDPSVVEDVAAVDHVTITSSKGG